MSTGVSESFVQCWIGEMCVGIQLDRIQEINRSVDATFVPKVAPEVCGVINLRGSLVTVLDLKRTVCGKPFEGSRSTRNVIVEVAEERVGLVVDRVGDVVVTRGPLEALPSHLERLHGKWFHGLAQLDDELLLVLDVDAAVDPANHTEGTRSPVEV